MVQLREAEVFVGEVAQPVQRTVDVCLPGRDRLEEGAERSFVDVVTSCGSIRVERNYSIRVESNAAEGWLPERTV